MKAKNVLPSLPWNFFDNKLKSKTRMSIHLNKIIAKLFC